MKLRVSLGYMIGNLKFNKRKCWKWWGRMDTKCYEVSMFYHWFLVYIFSPLLLIQNLTQPVKKFHICTSSISRYHLDLSALIQLFFFWPFLLLFSCYFFQIWKGLSSLLHQLLSPVFEWNPSFFSMLLSNFCQKPGSRRCSRNVCFYSFKFCWMPGFIGQFSQTFDNAAFGNHHAWLYWNFEM